jgi:hypothetical protein
VTNNNGLWIRWLDLLALLLQLQSVMTAHNQWLSKTRSIPYWITSVFSSTVMNDERLITAHILNCLERRLSDESPVHSQIQSQSYFTTGGLSPISSSWRQAPWDSRPQIFFQLNSCGNSPYVTSSLTRRWLHLLWIRLAFRQVYISHI